MRRRWIWIALVAVLVVGVAAGAWALKPAAPMPEALQAMESDQFVMVASDELLVFQPVDQATNQGLIFYPGGLVDPRAYAPAARAIAEDGYLVVIVPMPLNLAVLAPDKAEEVMAAYPAIEVWAVGGHSLGGAMGARYAYRNPGQVNGLALWAAYPASSDDLSSWDGAVASIYATNDGLTSLQDIEASRLLLPPDSFFNAIEGGNHAQFGWYGEQSGDNPATISREVQQEQVVEATLSLLQAMGGE